MDDRPVPSPWTRRITAACCLLAVVFAVSAVGEGVKAYNTSNGFRGGVPYGMLFFLAAIAAVAAAGDVRVLRFGMPRRAPRLKRHLWRMCFSLFIAAGSFFSNLVRGWQPCFLSRSRPGRCEPCRSCCCVACDLLLWRLGSRCSMPGLSVTIRWRLDPAG